MASGANRFLSSTGVAFLARLQYEFLKALVAPVSDHIPWRHISKHGVRRPKPQGSLDRVAVEKLRYQIAIELEQIRPIVEQHRHVHPPRVAVDARRSL